MDPQMDIIQDACWKGIKKNALVGIRTPNLWFRRPMLYPIELQAHFIVSNMHFRDSLSGRKGYVSQFLSDFKLFLGKRRVLFVQFAVLLHKATWVVFRAAVGF